MPATTPTLPRVRFSCVPNPIAELPDAEPEFLAVLNFIIRVARSRATFRLPTRAEIIVGAKVLEHTVIASLQWLQWRDIIRLDPDPDDGNRRLVTLLWDRAGKGADALLRWPDPDPEHPQPKTLRKFLAGRKARSGCAPRRRRRATTAREARNGSAPGAQPLRAPSYMGSETGETLNVSSPLPPAGPPAAPPAEAIDPDETRRDDSSLPSPEEPEEIPTPAEEARPEAVPIPPTPGDDPGGDIPTPEQFAEYEAIVAAAPERCRTGEVMAARLALKAFRRDGDRIVRVREDPPPRAGPAASSPVPSSVYAGNGKARPPRKPPDDAFPFERGILLLRAVRDAPMPGTAADVFAHHMLGRYHDSGNRKTFHTFRDAAMSPGVERVESRFREAERGFVEGTVRDPGRWLGTTLANDLASAREFRKKRRLAGAQSPAPGSPAKGPRGPVTEAQPRSPYP